MKISVWFFLIQVSEVFSSQVSSRPFFKMQTNFSGNTGFSVSVLRLFLSCVSRPFFPTTVYFSLPFTFRIFVSRLFCFSLPFFPNYEFWISYFCLVFLVLFVLLVLFVVVVVAVVGCAVALGLVVTTCVSRYQLPLFLQIFLELRRQPLQNGRSK